MACDSCWTDVNGYAGTLKNKITRLKSGALLGEAGDNDSRAVADLLQKVKSFAHMPTAKELAACQVDYAAIILFPDGDMAQISIEKEGTSETSYKAQAYPVNRGMSAVGSGGPLALGYMGADKTAAEAVAFATEWDRNSMLPVHDFTCQTPASRPDTKSRRSVRTGPTSKPSTGSRRTATQRQSRRHK